MEITKYVITAAYKQKNELKKIQFRNLKDYSDFLEDFEVIEKESTITIYYSNGQYSYFEGYTFQAGITELYNNEFYT